MQIPYNEELRPDTGLYNAKLGIWLFLASEVMLFGALFSAYIMLRTSNPYWFDMVIDRLEKVAPIEIQVVDAHFHKDDVDDEDIVDEAEDTLTILNKYIESMNTNVSKKQLDLLVKELYDEALTIV